MRSNLHFARCTLTLLFILAGCRPALVLTTPTQAAPQISIKQDPTATSVAPTIESPQITSTTPAVDGPYQVTITPQDVVEAVDNPYFPLTPGAQYVYEGQTQGGLEQDKIEILAEPRLVMGIPATVVHDVVRLDGELIEEMVGWR